MPTPHGSRGGMAFSSDELRVLRRALTQVLHPAVPSQSGVVRTPWDGDVWTEDVQDFLRLAQSIDEAVREGGRLRAFLLADLARYRDALPGGAPGYLERLEEAVADGYLPGPEDLRALRRLAALPCGRGEQARRSRLAGRCHALAEAAVRDRLAAAAATPPRHLTAVPAVPAPAVPAPAGRATVGRASAGRALAGHVPTGRALTGAAPTSHAPTSHAPTSHGGPIPMSTAEPCRPEPAAEQGAERDRGGQSGPRQVPTPADLFARRPRPAAPAVPEDHDDTELATGTG
ncbi:hypothetical protein LO771_08760 [Streptacidiphilus sp. ASG 303]|uniref:hypothetical protein n=1 Tax=Streptacidiphilus sp. ASG 303 TaxID=2896847 RepID=UPI001E2A6135|nr:hypothetical protein [Streptacidiphilus sp. ASG 303]MCD0482490.1 hypothetical protein [Streptacidiphilus sp. ASG 303]